MISDAFLISMMEFLNYIEYNVSNYLLHLMNFFIYEVMVYDFYSLDFNYYKVLNDKLTSHEKMIENRKHMFHIQDIMKETNYFPINKSDFRLRETLA